MELYIKNITPRVRVARACLAVAIPALVVCLQTCLLLAAASLVACQSNTARSVAGTNQVPFAMPVIDRPQIPNKVFNISEFGAVEGGTKKCTASIQKAIEAATKDGGGSVVIPNGTWLTGAIHLDNNINLHLEDHAVLLFSQDPADYLPVVFSRHEDVECYKYSSFIYARGKHDISITGKGTLSGQGKPWWPLKEKGLEKVLADMGDANVPVEKRVFDGTDGNALRPAFFQPMECKQILVEDVTFTYGAFWTITPTYCENVIVRNVHVVTDGEYGHTPNGDGVDPSSCRNVLIENCVFDTGDDCIAIKAGRDKDGIRVNKPTENVVVRNCKGLRGHGGIVIGSETSGGIRNIYAENCQFSGTDRIVRIKTARGRGGVLENMWFRDLTGEQIQMEAIHLNMLYTGKRLPAQPVTETTPSLQNIHFENITCTSGKSYAIEILGLPERSVRNVTFDGITTSTTKGFHIVDADSVSISHSSVTPAKGPAIDILDATAVVLNGITSAGRPGKFMNVEGPRTANIAVRNCGIDAKGDAISKGENVNPAAVTIGNAE